MSNKILITAASGNIGRELVSQLKAANADVVAGSSSSKAAAGIANRNVDFSDTETLKAAFSGIDTLFLLLPLVPNKIQLAENAIAAAKAAGVKHIVRSSGAGADPNSEFALPKLQGEIDQLIIASGIPYTLVRPATFMQNFATYYAGMIKGGALYLPQGEGRVSYIDVRDIAAVFAVILQSPAAHAGRAYTLTGAAALSNAEAMSAISEAIGKKVSYVAVPDAAAVESMSGMGMDAWSIKQMMSLHQLTALGHSAGTTDSVRQILDREPITFAEFLAAHPHAWD